MPDVITSDPGVAVLACAWMVGTTGSIDSSAGRGFAQRAPEGPSYLAAGSGSVGVKLE